MRAKSAVLATLAAGIALVACELAFPTHESDNGGSSVDGGGTSGEGGVAACQSTCPAPGTTLVSCTGTKTPCALGCKGDPALGARCVDLAPSGVAASSDYTGTTVDVSWTATTGYVIDTGSGAIMNGATTIRAPGTGLDGPSGITFRITDQLDDTRIGTSSPGLGVFGFHSLTVGKGTLVSVVGARAAAILVDTDLIIDGTVSARGVCDAGHAGPGGFAHDNGPRVGGPGVAYICNSTQCIGAGGGAGFDTTGGAGDAKDHISAGGAAFPLFDGGPFVLFGGSGGGSGGGGGGGGGGNAGLGGAGGGGLQLAANRSFALSGTLDACGCGGRSESGGAAGGMIVVESPSVTLNAGSIIASNGGAGGGFNGAGADGNLSAQQANGSNNGGRGGALQGTATNGGNSGGGGGAVGRVIVNSLSPANMPDGGIVSPAPSFGSIVGK